MSGDRAARPRQLAFDLPVRPALGREDFFISAANEAAVAAIDRWPEWAAPMLFVVGPAGSGKTHLAQVWHGITGAPSLAAEALRTEAIPEALSAGALIVEDAPGEALDERALFHLMNLSRERRASVLITSRLVPAHWPVALPDLRSRLRASPVVELGPPDDALLRAVLVKHFADRQIVVGEAVVTYLLARMERSLDAARRLVAEIDARALAAKAEVTRSLVARVLAEWQEPGLFDGR